MQWQRRIQSGTVLALCFAIGAAGSAFGQKASEAVSPAKAADRWAGVGDAPDTAPPLAKHLSAKLTVREIDKAMRKVGGWELTRSRQYFSQDWTFAALYTGFMAASRVLPDTEYKQAMLEMGKKFNWQLGPRTTYADDQAVGQTYLGLYAEYHDPAMIRPIQERFDQVLKMPDDPARPMWWWCDALFMAPPVWARLAQATNNQAYLDYMDREWWITSRLLYDQKEHLYFRDASFFDKKQDNGKPIFWSRGNGWVMGGLTRVLDAMPQNYPARAKYVEQFRQMASRIAELQQADGLWSPGLLDAKQYPLPEVSGSAFFVYALAWGVDRGILDKKTYMPVVRKGWKGLLAHVYEDGRLGCIQPIGAAPGDFKPTSSYVYGVGAFLLAGAELHNLAGKGVH
jgi:rhamnogalacturonyl hydrolase YesR